MMAEKRSSEKITSGGPTKSKTGDRRMEADKRRREMEAQPGGHFSSGRGRATGASLLILAIACVLAARFAAAAENAPVVTPGTKPAETMREKAREIVDEVMHYDGATNTYDAYIGDNPKEQVQRDMTRQSRIGNFNQLPVGAVDETSSVRSSLFARDNKPLDAETYRARYDEIEQQRIAHQREYTQEVRNIESRMGKVNRDSDEYKRLRRELEDAGKRQAESDRRLGEDLMELDSRRPGNINLMLNR